MGAPIVANFKEGESTHLSGVTLNLTLEELHLYGDNGRQMCVRMAIVRPFPGCGGYLFFFTQNLIENVTFAKISNKINS